MQIYLDNEIKPFFAASKCVFTQIMALRGERFRYQKGRLTQRITLGNKNYFIKQHYGVGWKEILKNILQGRMPVLSAMNEVNAIKKLADLNIAVPKIVAFGIKGSEPSKQQSFIIMQELAPTISLEDYCKNWQNQPPKFSEKHQLIKKVAHIASTLHTNGINHRDFYICHFLLCNAVNTNSKPLYLIDLHRAQIRKKTPQRWLQKDLSALYFSSKDIGLTTRDLYRFIKWYRQLSLRQIFKTEGNFWQQIKSRGEKIYRDHN